jgi:Ribonuclease G/E
VTVSTLKVPRIGENVYALVEDGQIVELKIFNYAYSRNAIAGQVYIGRIKDVETRLSGAFIDMGEEVGFLSFDGPRPKYLTIGNTIKVKVQKPRTNAKLALVQFVGEVAKQSKTIGQFTDVAEWGNWPHPREATSFEADEIMAILEEISLRSIEIENGGNITIEHTSALTAIDIDAGRRTAGGTNQRNFNHKLNISAAKEIMRQIKLRNLGGLIVIDFVGAPSKIEAAELLHLLKQYASMDRKCEILPLSKFGLCEIARENLDLPLYEILGRNGERPNPRIAVDAINALAKELQRSKGEKVRLEITAEAYNELKNWNFDWQNYIRNNIGGQFDVVTAPIKEFEVKRNNALPDML